MKNTKVLRHKQKKIALSNSCALKGIKLVTDFVQFGKKIKNYCIYFRNEIERPKEIYENKTLTFYSN